jgi:hypothetical protein
MLINDLQAGGHKMTVKDNEIYFKQYDFEKKQDCKYDTSFDQPIDQVDFSAMSDQDLWSYIFGEYLIKARLASEFKGLGMTQVPRDKNKLANKIHELGCEGCERKDTENCHKFKAGT